MVKEKHHVFSARTTEEGLKILNQLKAERGIGWDELVIDAVCAHYGLDMGVMALPKAERLPKAEKPPKESKAKKAKEPKAEKAEAGVAEAETGE